jgi:nickel transport protein
MVSRIGLILSLSLLFCALPLLAHGLKVYAHAAGDTIQGEVHFAGGAGASGALVRISDAEGKVLAVVKPDAEGHFSYRLKRPMDVVVEADSLDGHQARWYLKAEAFSGAGAAREQGEVAVSRTPAPSVSGPVTAETAGSPCDEVLARQTQSMQEALMACEERVRLRDILGGLGYIVGLAGLGLWWGCRRRQRT